MNTPPPAPYRYDPSSFPGMKPPFPPEHRSPVQKLAKWAVIAIPLILVLGPLLWDAVPAEIARWHARSAQDKYLAGDLPGAIASLDAAITWNSKGAELYYLRAIYKQEHKDYTGSLADCDEALSRLPNRKEILTIRGRTLQHLKRFPEALSDFQEIEKQVEASPRVSDEDRAGALNGTAYARAVGSLELPEGLAGVERSLLLLGGEAYIWEQAGYLHLLRKDWPRAKVRLLEAAGILETELAALEPPREPLAEQVDEQELNEKRPDDPSGRRSGLENRLAAVQFHLGQVLTELKETEEAAKFEKLASAWNRPEHALRDRVPSLDVAWKSADRHAGIVDTRAYLQFKLKNLSAARRDAELAGELMELAYQKWIDDGNQRKFSADDARIHKMQQQQLGLQVAVVIYHRALIYEQLGLKDLAADDLRKVKEVYGATPGDDLF